jgi:hypothetical protein
MLLTLRPSTSQNTKAQTNPTQLLIRVITAYQSHTNTARPSEAGSSDTGVILGKQMKEEEYYLAIWAPGARADEVSLVRPLDRSVSFSSKDNCKGTKGGSQNSVR